MTTAQVAAGVVTKPISGWGRYPVQRCTVLRPERYADLARVPAGSIVRGQGRSYGDAALNAGGHVILTERLNRVLEFDTHSGVVRAEAGATLQDILAITIPRGWFLPVTPGTKYVSLGGCVAADVHGKNHHRAGSFGEHVHEIELIVAGGRRVRCSPREEAPLFWATVGGMGLTGVIGEVTFGLIPIESSWVCVEHRQAPDLEAALALLDDGAFDDHYSVAWIDCLARGPALGRSIVMRGHHAVGEELPAALRPRALEPVTGSRRRVPFDLPSWSLGPWSVKAFNALYYHRQSARNGPFLSPCDPYFYPLDALGDWNRLYGSQGFVQYQCVLPSTTAFEGLRDLLRLLSESRRASFLAVLKRFGPAGRGMLSFPMAGYTLALDIPLRDDALFSFLNALDDVVLRCGGRVYLAKDSRLRPETFRAMYPRHGEWLAVKRAVDPENRFRSSLSSRLGMAN